MNGQMKHVPGNSLSWQRRDADGQPDPPWKVKERPEVQLKPRQGSRTQRQ